MRYLSFIPSFFLVVFSFGVQLKCQIWEQINMDYHDSFIGTSLRIPVSINKEGNVIAFSDFDNPTNSIYPGRVIVQKYNGSFFEQQAGTIRGDSSKYSIFGERIQLSASGKTIAIGTTNRCESNPYCFESILIFDLVGDSLWRERPNPITRDLDLAHEFSLSDDGNTLATAQPQDGKLEFYLGRISIFEWQKDHWIKKGEDIWGTAENAYLGTELSLSGDGNTLVATHANTVLVYSWNGQSWNKKGRPIDRFGGVETNSNGTVIAVGGHNRLYWPEGTFSPGKIDVLEWRDNGWRFKGGAILGDIEGLMLGFSFDLNAIGDRILVGCPFHSQISNEFVGFLRLYQFDRGTWIQHGENITAMESRDGTHFGRSLALNGAGDKLIAATGYEDTPVIVAPFQESSVTSTPSEERKLLFKVYPNPISSNSLLHVEFDLINSTPKYEYKITSLTGQTVQKGQIVPHRHITNIDISNLKAANYFLTVSNQKATQTLKFVVKN